MADYPAPLGSAFQQESEQHVQLHQSDFLFHKWLNFLSWHKVSFPEEFLCVWTAKQNRQLLIPCPVSWDTNVHVFGANGTTSAFSTITIRTFGVWPPSTRMWKPRTAALSWELLFGTSTFMVCCCLHHCECHRHDSQSPKSTTPLWRTWLGVGVQLFQVVCAYKSGCFSGIWFCSNFEVPVHDFLFALQSVIFF